MVYFFKDSVQYKAYNTYDLILNQEVPAVVAFNNFDLIEKYNDSIAQNDRLKLAEVYVQAQINEYVEAKTRKIARELDYVIAISFINMDALKYEEFQQVNDADSSSTVETDRKALKVKEDIKKMRNRVKYRLR